MLKPVVAITGLLLIQVLSSDAVCPAGCTSCSSGRVRCPGAGLTAPPSTLPDDTLSIDLTHNKIADIDHLPKLNEVQSLRMSMNQLKVIKGNAFMNMPSLVSLDLSMNMISKVYKHGLRGLDNLMSISLSGNEIDDIGIIFKNTQQLISVRLGNNQLQTITEDYFKTNTMIKMLDLSNNKITTIEGDAFKNLDMLRYLLLSNNPITTITDLTFTSTMLSLADFTSCSLTSVPKTMPPSLVDYRLGNNQIERINVEDFENITSLKMLTLNDNKISHVDHRSFATLVNLKELWLSRNDLVYIPRGLPKALQKLFIDNNVVVELEQMLFQTESELIELILERNKISKIHADALKNTQNLIKLDLQGNEMKVIEAGTFTNVSKLESLTLSDNPVEIIENGAFADLQSLSQISLSYIDSSLSKPDQLLTENIFTEMPNLTHVDIMSSPRLTKAFLKILEGSTVVALDQVKKWNMQYNDLFTLPSEMKDLLPHTKQLLLDGNLLACDRRILWLNDWMRTSDASFHQYDPPTCNSPEALKGKKISDVAPAEFGKPEEQETPPPPQQVTEAVVEEPQEPIVNTDNSKDAVNNVQEPRQETQQDNQQQAFTGTVVRIKPPKSTNGKVSTTNSGASSSSGNGGSSSSPSKPSKQDKKLSKKELRKLERERKRKLKEERKRQKKLKAKQAKNGKGGSRKKRKINKKKECLKDASGKEVCGRRKRCKVLEDGTVRCRKRKQKKSAEKSASQKS